MKKIIFGVGTCGEPGHLAHKVAKKLQEYGQKTVLFAICKHDCTYLDSSRLELVFSNEEVKVFREEGQRRKYAIFYLDEQSPVKVLGERVKYVAIIEENEPKILWIPVTAAQRDFEEAYGRATIETHLTSAIEEFRNHITNSLLITTAGNTGLSRVSILLEKMGYDAFDAIVVVGCNFQQTSNTSQSEGCGIRPMQRFRIEGIRDSDQIVHNVSSTRTTRTSREDALSQIILRDQDIGKFILVNTDPNSDDPLAEALAMAMLPSTGSEFRTFIRVGNPKALAFKSIPVNLGEVAAREWNYLSLRELEDLDPDFLAELIGHRSSLWIIPANLRINRSGRLMKVERGSGIVSMFPIPQETLERIFYAFPRFATNIKKYGVTYREEIFPGVTYHEISPGVESISG